MNKDIGKTYNRIVYIIKHSLNILNLYISTLLFKKNLKNSPRFLETNDLSNLFISQRLMHKILCTNAHYFVRFFFKSYDPGAIIHMVFVNN